MQPLERRREAKHAHAGFTYTTSLITPGCPGLSRRSSHPARFTLQGHTVQGGRLLCLFLESMLAPWCQRGEGLGWTQQSLLRRRLPLCGLRVTALELAWLWQSGQDQVLSKHWARSAASPSPLAPVKSFPGRMQCSAGQASAGMGGRAFLGARTWWGWGELRGLPPSSPAEIISSPQPPCQLSQEQPQAWQWEPRATSGFSPLACWLTPSKAPILSGFPFLPLPADLVAFLPYLNIIETL